MPAVKSRMVSDSCAPTYTAVRSCAFADSNIPLYLLSMDAQKVVVARTLLHARCFISVQVLNEISSVMRRKHQYTWAQIERFLDVIRAQCPVEPLTETTHDTARQLAERYQLSLYDALIAAAALLAGCDTLYSEDMQHGLLLEKRLRVVNPFV